MSEPLEISVGASASEEVTVTRELTVAHRAPGMPEVYATPMMIYLMEIASAHAIQPFLPVGWVSVGTEVNVRHLAATPIGFVVNASATVIAVNGRTVTFAVRAHDGVELIGEGTHTRTLVSRDRFNARAAAKAAR
ncbi:MAG TPA: thioesterase family protein [Thermoanaerobaculia bacterium]|nr:thioesterase family protein [Thermoanaerobaculia bacterium]